MMMIALAMLLPQLALAQNTEAKVKKIRQLYNEAQNTAQFKDSEEWMEHGAWSLKFESMINYAGGGPVKHRTEILLTSPFESDEPDNPRFNTVIPWLVRETIERSATIYREFLYDPQTEEFIFCYQRVAGYNEPKEQRLYFDKGRLIKAVPASMDEVWMEEPSALIKKAQAIKEMVKAYNNIEYCKVRFFCSLGLLSIWKSKTAFI